MNVLFGVSGGIACYKSCTAVSALTKSGCEVNVVLTKNAAEFVTPLTFQALTHRHVYCEMFDGVADREIAHINLAKQADVFVIAPATANIIAKLACGIADDLLTSAVLAAVCPVIVCPAMNGKSCLRRCGQRTNGRAGKNRRSCQKRLCGVVRACG